MKHGLDQISGSLSRGVESLKKSAQSRGGSTSVYCKGVRQLDNYGYEKFNLEDGGDEIFISRHSEKSMFNEDDSILIRATDGNFVTQPDTTKVAPVAEEAVIEMSDARKLFGNVPMSNTPCDIQGVVGTVEQGKIVPTPIDNSFLARMTTKPAHGMQKLVDRDQEFEKVMIPDVSEVSAEESVEEIPESSQFGENEVHVTSVEDEDVEPEIVDVSDESEVPAVLVADVVSESEVAEGVDGPAEDALVAFAEESEDAVAPMEDDDSFVFIDDEESSEEFVDVVVSDDEEVADGVHDVTFEQIAEASVEETVEASEVTDGSEDVPEQIEASEEDSEIADEHVMVEPRIEQTVEVPAMDEKPKGLYLEGDHPSDVATVTSNAEMQIGEVTATGTTAVEAARTRVGLDADGEALPPMSDPVIKRPRSTRFRFANGVLMSVDSKAEGSQEGPTHPLE